MSLLPSLFGSSVGRKVVMAGSGVLLLLFLLAHLLGNLQIFSGPAALNGYAHLLHSKPLLVWLARLAVLALFALHIVTSVQLTLQNRAARPQAYQREETLKASLAARTMIWSGLVVGAFLVYHLLHLTAQVTGPVGQVTAEGGPDVYANVTASFRDPLIAGVYLVAQILLLFHLLHAFQSALQTLGWRQRRFSAALERAGQVYALLIAGGNVAIVAAVWMGWV
jgi:succinate dehydrogenase / fumarate reductase cytochrome b subunit